MDTDDELALDEDELAFLAKTLEDAGKFTADEHGEFTMHDINLAERNAWLARNAEAVAPYVREPRDCIVFTLTRTEPSDRATTRLGGLPYWPRRRPWPACTFCGEPLQFAAQLDFRDPRIRPTVPGDVLTFHYCFGCFPEEGCDTSLLTWHGPEVAAELVAPEDVPPVPSEHAFGPFYGQARDALDYPAPAEAYGGGIAGTGYTYLQFTLQGTKIGGYPPRIQPFEPPVDSSGRPMRFLGTIGSAQGYIVDQRGDSIHSDGDLLWGDMGSVYLWISEADSREVSWFMLCY